MAKSDHQDQGELRFKSDVPHIFFLFSDHLHQVCKRIYTVSFAISCKIVMSKYNLLISLRITHSSMIMCNRLHPDHAQALVDNSYKLTEKSSFVRLLCFCFQRHIEISSLPRTTPIAKSSITFAPYKEYYCSTHQ